MSKLQNTYARSRVALYIQVASALRRRIETSEWLPGQKISTLEELEAEFEVARVTVRQAVEMLQNEGLLHRQQGRGTFVANTLQDKHWLKLDASWDALIAPIKDNIPRIIRVDHPPEWPALGPDDGDRARKYVFLRSVQSRQGRDGAPFAVVNLHLDETIYRRDPAAFRTHTALPVLASLKDADIGAAHQTLVIGSADPTTANLLQVPLGTPTAECRCVVSNRKGIAVYVAEIIYRNDCIKLYINLLGDGKPPALNGNGKSHNKPAKERASKAVGIGKPGKARNKPPGQAASATRTARQA